MFMHRFRSADIFFCLIVRPFAIARVGGNSSTDNVTVLKGYFVIVSRTD